MYKLQWQLFFAMDDYMVFTIWEFGAERCRENKNNYEGILRMITV